METDTANLSSTPEAGAAETTDTGTSIDNEVGLGNLSAVQHTMVGQGALALPSGPPAIAAAGTSLLSYHQANLAAVMRSGQAFASGAYEVRKVCAEASVASLNDANEVMAALAAVRCVKDLVDVQSKLVLSTMEKAFTRGAQVADSSMKLTHQALEPISDRISASTRAFVHAG